MPVRERTLATLVALTFALPPPLLAAPPPATEPVAPTPSPAQLLPQLQQAARSSTLAWERLAYLTDRIGARLANTPATAKAVQWAVATLTADGHDNVRTEPVMVPDWRRGRAGARLLAPVEREIPILALGGSVGTPGVEAPVVVVRSFAELGPQVAGTIVVFNVPMGEGVPTIQHYGAAAAYRTGGASAAARHGAVAVLVRSVTTRSLATLHTGLMVYADDAPRIPAAAITTEDADTLDRLARAGVSLRLRVEMDAADHGTVESHNVLAEIRGRQRPEEIVLVGAHLDSWDVGQGVHDDGVGVVHVLETMRLIRALPVPPRRTIRAILFTCEEQGVYGGRAYAATHGGERHVAALESDLGAFRPRAWGASGSREQPGWLVDAARPLGLPVFAGGGGADIAPLAAHGVLLVGLYPDDTHYFDVHHSPADTLDKVDPQELTEGLAAFAGLAWLLANTD